MNGQIAEELLLRPAGLGTERVRERVAGVMRRLDWADVYVPSELLTSCQASPSVKFLTIMRTRLDAKKN